MITSTSHPVTALEEITAQKADVLLTGLVGSHVVCWMSDGRIYYSCNLYNLCESVIPELGFRVRTPREFESVLNLLRNALGSGEMRETVRGMLADWDAAEPDARANALAAAARLAKEVSRG